MIDAERLIIKPCRHGYSKHESESLPYKLQSVNYKENISLRRAVYRFASYFRREFCFDFVQYSLTREKHNEDEVTLAYLFSELEYTHKRISYGACCFRYRDKTFWKNISPHWGMQWIWIHPYMRGKGLLTEFWPYFEEKYGNFMLERPVSKAMESFLKTKTMKFKHDYDELLLNED